MTIFDAITLLGGLALFLYGMRIMGNGLKEGSTDTLKKVMGMVTNNPIKSFLLGMIVTAIIQSSTATIVITSGLVGAGIITLHQSVGIILGANVGTTITGQIIRLLDVDASGASWLNFFKPQTLAPLAAIIGIIFLMFLTKRKNSSTIGTVAMGFGILFTGLLSMTAAVQPLSQTPAFTNAITAFSKSPVLGYIVGAAVAFVLQSSSATIGILQAMSVTGAFTFSSVYAIIVGVYLGDCVTTAIVCSIGAKADAKRTGVIHILFNLCETVIVLVGVTVLHKLGALDGIWNMTMNSGSIANTHTVFNLTCALLLIPLGGMFEKASLKLVKDDKVVGANIDAELSALDEKLFSSPALALSAAKIVIMKMAMLATSGVNDAMDTLIEYDQDKADLVTQNEEHIDRLADAVDNYLIKLSSHVPPGSNSDLLNFYIQVFSEFERIGDYAVNLTEDAEELKNKGEVFTDQAKKELGIIKDALNDIMGHTVAAFKHKDINEAREIEPIEEVVDDLVATLRGNHTKRLREGKCNIYSGLTFLDSLVNIERVADQCSNVGVYLISLFDTIAGMSHHEYIQKLHKGEDEFFNRRYQEDHDAYYARLAEIGD